MKLARNWLAIIALMLSVVSVSAAWAASSDTIAPGTVINMQNWRQYQQFMPDGMKGLFAGSYHWTFPDDFQLIIGPTRHYPLGSKEYFENTERYARQVRIINLPNGGQNIVNYTAGLPFPNPQEPLKGWKILVNDWFAYQPWILCSTTTAQWFQDRFGNVSANTLWFQERRTAHISDPGQPLFEQRVPAAEFVQYAEQLTPEQARYTAILSFWPRDSTQPVDLYVFLPALRRTLRLSTTARCSPAFGSDFVYDDTRHGAFNGSFTMFDGKFIRDQKILEAVDYNVKDAAVPTNRNYFFSRIWWSKPSLSKWEVRDSYMVDVHRIPAMASGYCYGSRVLYVDKEVMQAM